MNDSKHEVAVGIDNLKTSLQLDSLRKTPADQILNPVELAYYESLKSDFTPPSIETTFPHIVIVMKATRLCNLRCVYCNQWRSGPNHKMPFKTIARVIRDAQWSLGTKVIDYAWHGGEPTLMPIEFFIKALWLQLQFQQPGQQTLNSIQTNGTLLTPKWLDFLKSYKFSVGVSLDGPAEINDKRRIDRRGKSSTDKVIKGVKSLNTHNIPYGVLCVVDNEIINLGAKRLLDYFVESDIKSVALLNQIPENNDSGDFQNSYIPFDDYVRFLQDLFAIWWRQYQDKIALRDFIDLLKPLQKKGKAQFCYYSGNCIGKFITVEPNGDITSCDKFIDLDDYSFGNIFNSDSLCNLLSESKNMQKSWSAVEESGAALKQCKWHDRVCHGGCPHDRRINQLTGSNSRDCCGLKPLLETMSSAIK